MTKRILWTLPAPSTSLTGRGPFLEDRPRRELAVRFSYERGDGKEEAVSLILQGVEAFRITYVSACVPEASQARDQLIDRDQTGWLASTKASMSRNGERSGDVRHLMISFGNGPCYEAICRSFRIEEGPTRGERTKTERHA